MSQNAQHFFDAQRLGLLKVQTAAAEDEQYVMGGKRARMSR